VGGWGASSSIALFELWVAALDSAPVQLDAKLAAKPFDPKDYQIAQIYHKCRP